MKQLNDFLSTQHNLSKHARLGYRSAILAFDRLSGKEFEDTYLDETIVHSTLSKLQEKYEEASWNHYLTLYKRYAKWLSDTDDEACPKLWSKIKLIKIDWEEKLKDKWLTEEEFRHFLESVDNTRDRAMFGVCVEGALRVGELIGLKVRDCKPTSYGFDVMVSGKTGSGSFPVVLFAPLLKQWLNVHPCKDQIDAPLWPVRHDKHFEGIKKGAVEYNFIKYAEYAGINRHVTVHVLRHTKITWTAKSTEIGVSDEMAKKMFRWTKNSRMYSHYSHLFGVDSTKTFLALAGVKEEESEKSTLLTRQKCFNCGEENSADALYCFRCGFVLDQEQAKRIVAERRMMEDLMKWFEAEKSKK